MKKYAPFVVTGLLSAGLALGLFALFLKPVVLVESSSPQTVFTNYTPYGLTSSSEIPVGSPDLVTMLHAGEIELVQYILFDRGSRIFLQQFFQNSDRLRIVLQFFAIQYTQRVHAVAYFLVCLIF